MRQLFPKQSDAPNFAADYFRVFHEIAGLVCPVLLAMDLRLNPRQKRQADQAVATGAGEKDEGVFKRPKSVRVTRNKDRVRRLRIILSKKAIECFVSAVPEDRSDSRACQTVPVGPQR